MNHHREFGGHFCGRHGGRSASAEHGHPGRGPRGRFRRHFRTREERIARLESYLSELRLEAQAVEELLAELRAAG